MKIDNKEILKKFKENSFLEFFEEKTVYRVDLNDDYTCDEIYYSYEEWCVRNFKCADTREQVELILKEMGMDGKIQCSGKTYYRYFTLRNMGDLIDSARLEQIIDNAGTEEDSILLYVGEKYKGNGNIFRNLKEYCDKKNYCIVDTLSVDDIRDEVTMHYELEDDRYLMATLINTIENFGPTRIVTLNSKMISIDYDLLEELINTLRKYNVKLEFVEENSY